MGAYFNPGNGSKINMSTGGTFYDAASGTADPSQSYQNDGLTQSWTGWNPGTGPVDSGGSTTTYEAPVYVDPYAAWGGKAAYDSLVNDYNSSKTTTMNSITDSENDAANSYHSGLLDYLDSVKLGQNKINNQTTQNELAKIQGNRSILDMVSHGIRSSGVMLGNRNASTSSASEALANAWGENGRREAGKVGNQYEQGKSGIAMSQADFDTQMAQGARHLNENKTTIVNGIISSAVAALGDLNAKAASANLPDRIEIESEKNRIRAEAMAKLQAFDGELAAGQAANKPITQDAAMAQAFQMSNAGTAATNPFQFSTDVPTQLQGTGPFASELPLFTYKKNNQ